MKIIAIILLTGLVYSCGTTKVPTDIREYGHSGEVKSISELVYLDLERDSSGWIITDENKVAEITRHFNSDGNIYRIEETSIDIENEWNSFTTEITFIDLKKDSYIKKKADGSIDEVAKYTWEDDQHYSIFIDLNEGMVLYSEAVLNEDYRDIAGNYSYLQDGDSVFCESYINEFDAQGNLISASFTDLIMDEEYKILITEKKYDSHGNLIQSALIDSRTKNLHRLFVRVFEYY